MYKKALSLLISLALCLSLSGCSQSAAKTGWADGENPEEEQYDPTRYKQYADMTAEEIVSQLTLEQKVAQMLQPAGYEIDARIMKRNGYGSALSIFGLNAKEWKKFIIDMQQGALASPAGIPFIYGNDAVHGVNNCSGTVIFPHNIGIGAANDAELTYQMGLAVADEAKLTGMLWTFSPCVASAQDPRWGRTYESYSSDVALVTAMSTAFSKGLIEGGILPCAKHFLGDGDALFGTGEDGLLIDRGDAQIDEARMAELLSVYQSLIGTGVNSVMITHGAINGTKAHASKELITDVLKGELGFEGLVVSDWESIHNIITDGELKDQLVMAVNAGIDMLMEPNSFDECIELIVESVNEGLISEERIDDAVTRIIRVKKEMGLFDDPLMERMETVQSETGSAEYCGLARQLVEKSLVLLKNDNDILPLNSGAKLFITGPASNDTGVMCGGWTSRWEGSMDTNGIRALSNGKTILDGFQMLADEYGFTIITDPEKAAEADVTILCVGEKPYAEWLGDTEDLSITGELGLMTNEEAITQAVRLGKPTVTCIVAGRNVIYDQYEAQWDAVVMCYLPGTEGDGVATVLAGKVPFSGKLPMPYYSAVEDIRSDRVKFTVGYGMTTGE